MEQSYDAGGRSKFLAIGSSLEKKSIL